MATVKAFIDHLPTKKKNDSYQIKIRVRHTRNKKEDFPTGEYLKDRSDFDIKAGRVRSLKKLDHQRINKLLIERIAELQGRTSPIQADGQIKTIRQKDDIIAEYKHKLKISKVENSESTSDLYYYSFKHFTTFLKSEHNKEKLTTDEVDHILLDEYKIYLKSKNLSDSSIKTYFGHLGTIYNRIGSRLRLNGYSPFKDYKLPIEKKKTLIPNNSLDKIQRYIPSTQRRIEVKNMGLLQYYCQGSRVSDILNIRWSDMKLDNHKVEEFEDLKNSKKEADVILYYLNKPNLSYKDVKLSLKFKSVKTKKEHDIPLSNKAILQLRFFLDRDLQLNYLGDDNIFDKELRRFLRVENPHKTFIQTDEDLASRLKPFIIEQIERSANKCITHKVDLDKFNKAQFKDWMRDERSKINRMLKEIKKEENYPLKFRLKTHSWRHMFSINYYTAKRDIYSLSKLLYHSNVGTTENYLSKLDIKLICDTDIVKFYDD